MDTTGSGEDDASSPAHIDAVARRAVEAAAWVPSLPATRPWWFTVHGDRIRLNAESGGRETLISCGAALHTLRLAIRAAGHAPEIHALPDPGRPLLLAEARIGGPLPVLEDARRMCAQAGRRRTHRGAFRPSAVIGPILSALRFEAEAEGAGLLRLVGTHTKGALVALTHAADHARHCSPGPETAITGRPPSPEDGVHPDDPPHTDPHCAVHGRERGARPSVTGTGLLITTRTDGPHAWLRAGQALQRVLLRAGAEHGLAAAFHTQALEIPELREFIRVRFCSGAHPQVLLRLGEPDGPDRAPDQRPAAPVAAGGHRA
ncbi:Acg family FMN-binding oxidoreductase [Spirillospora sp. CA-253888]